MVGTCALSGGGKKFRIPVFGMDKLKTQILVDNPASWILPYALTLRDRIVEERSSCEVVHEHEAVVRGDILFLLSCEHIFRRLDLNTHNLVVHESALPAGRGWSPLTWQILEGRNEVPITLLEAAESPDAGVIYDQRPLNFRGDELLDELRQAQGEATIAMCLRFIRAYPSIEGVQQSGEASYYRKRTPQDSELRVLGTIEEQFNLLRIWDNARYPAFFVRNGVKYLLTIRKA
jgi:methionyl-tRNA formyltransferase